MSVERHLFCAYCFGEDGELVEHHGRHYHPDCVEKDSPVYQLPSEVGGRGGGVDPVGHVGRLVDE